MNKILFDHTYTFDKNHKFLKSLKKKGFALSTQKREHPNKLFCRFIYFKTTSDAGRKYLEFVNCKSRKFKFNIPGISFGVRGNLKKFYYKIKKDKFFNVDFKHRNYEWKKDSKSRLPGWNFITFNKVPIRSFYFWMTEYENYYKRNKTIKPIVHKNGVQKVLGFEFDLSQKALDFFKKLLGKKLSRINKLDDETILIINKRETSKYKNVILKCENLETFFNVAKPDMLIDFYGQPAALINNPSGDWNIIVVDRDIIFKKCSITGSTYEKQN